MAFVGAARTLLPRGRRFVEVLTRRVAGSANVDFGGVLDQVGRPSEDSITNSDDTNTDMGTDFGRRIFELENMDLTPTTPRRQKPQIGDVFYVARISQQFDAGKISVLQTNNDPINNDRKTDQQRTVTQQFDDATIAVIKLVRVSLGERRPVPDPMQLPTNVAWLSTRQSMQNETDIKDIIIKQVHDRLQKIEVMMLERKTPRVLMLQRMDTPTNACINYSFS